MIKFKLVGAIVFILLLSCDDNKTEEIYVSDVKSELNDSTIVYPQLYEIEELFAPAQFSLQSNKGGLVITPRVPVSGYSLFYYLHEEIDTCCSQMKGLMKSGRGPGESGAIISGTRTADSDTIVYYSIDTSRFYHYDQNLNLTKDPLVSVRDILITDRFTYSNGKYYSEATFSDEEKILRIYDSTTKTTKTLIDKRIPRGFQPAARNNIASITSTPEHVLFALVGEKEIFILNNEDQVECKIILGENDPLPKPFKSVSNDDVKRSLQHIFKMEYYDGKLFVLMKSGLVVLNSNYDFIARFVFSDNNSENLDISDFTVNDEMLYLRKGLSDLYRVDYYQLKSALIQSQTVNK